VLLSMRFHPRRQPQVFVWASRRPRPG
jgi:hypothetical protein